MNSKNNNKKRNNHKDMRVKYVNVSIPKPLVDKVDKKIKGNGLYFSRSEFVKEAIREKLKE